MKKTTLVLQLIAAAVAFCYLLLFASLESLPFLDLPNHLTRALILKHLFAAAESPYRELFAFEWQFNTYLLGDFLLIALLSVFSFKVAGLVFVMLSFLSFPVGVVSYARHRGHSELSQLLLFLLTLFLSTNWFFLSGFLNFSLSIGLAFLTILFFEKAATKTGSVNATALFVAVLLTYFVHLSGFVAAGAVCGVQFLLSSFQLRKINTRLLVLLLPFVLVCVLHIALGGAGDGGGSQLAFRTLANKILAFGSMFYRFSLTADVLLLTLYMIIALYLPVMQLLRRRSFSNKQWQDIAIVVALTVLYAVLPVAVNHGYDVDNRVLPFIFTFLAFIGLPLLDSADREDQIAVAAVPLALLIAVLNLTSLWRDLLREDRLLSRYEQLIMTLPEHSSVLPVATVPDVGRIQTLLHAGSFYTAYKAGYTPYLFSRTESHPQSYFLYRNRRYAPDIFWYLRDKPVDWRSVEQQYDFVIITKPFDTQRFPKTFVTAVQENEVAAVYATKGDATLSPPS